MVYSLWGLFVGKLLLFYMKEGRNRRWFCSSCALDYNLNLMNSSHTVVNYRIKFSTNLWGTEEGIIYINQNLGKNKMYL